MKRIIPIIILTFMLICLFVMPVLADDTDNTNENTDTSLTDIINANKQDTTTRSQQIIEDLGKAADMSEVSPAVAKTASGLHKAVSFVVQLICYALTVGLSLRCALDLLYIGVPIFRSFLANGHVGNPQAGAGGMPGQGMMGGFGGFGYGLGTGFGTGFGGYGGYGGYGRYGLGGYGGMYGGLGAMGQGQPGMPGLLGKIQFVSNAALNAVAAETTLGPDGKPVSPLKVYAKDMIVILIAVPILITLAVTGVLTQFGFMIGDIVTGAISSIGGGL